MMLKPLMVIVERLQHAGNINVDVARDWQTSSFSVSVHP